MADKEVALTTFDLNPTIKFDAADIASDLSVDQVLDLIEELDGELNSWEATILLARYFERALQEAPAELMTMSDEDLADRISAEGEAA